MDNPEEVLHCLDEFAKLKPKDIPRELEDYLVYVARTGDPVYQWPVVKCLFREKLLNVITEFYETTPTLDSTPSPNVDPFNYENMKRVLLERLEAFPNAPFTVQRLCELLTTPRKEYNRPDKFMRAIEKNILVVSTREPGSGCRPDSALSEPLPNGLSEPTETASNLNVSVDGGADTSNASFSKETSENHTAEFTPTEPLAHVESAPSEPCSTDDGGNATGAEEEVRKNITKVETESSKSSFSADVDVANNIATEGKETEEPPVVQEDSVSLQSDLQPSDSAELSSAVGTVDVTVAAQVESEQVAPSDEGPTESTPVPSSSSPIEETDQAIHENVEEATAVEEDVQESQLQEEEKHSEEPTDVKTESAVLNESELSVTNGVHSPSSKVVENIVEELSVKGEVNVAGECPVTNETEDAHVESRLVEEKTPDETVPIEPQSEAIKETESTETTDFKASADSEEAVAESLHSAAEVAAPSATEIIACSEASDSSCADAVVKAISIDQNIEEEAEAMDVDESSNQLTETEVMAVAEESEPMDESEQLASEEMS